jgi:hypothetical protein
MRYTPRCTTPLTPRHKCTVRGDEPMMIRPYKPRDSARSALLTADLCVTSRRARASPSISAAKAAAAPCFPPPPPSPPPAASAAAAAISDLISLICDVVCLPRKVRKQRCIVCILLTRRRGADTAHTQMGRPTYEAPTREYTHKHTQTQTNTQRGPTKYGADSRRGGALLIRGGRLAPTPSMLHLCRDLRDLRDLECESIFTAPNNHASDHRQARPRGGAGYAERS